MTCKQKVWSTGVLFALAIAALTRVVLADAADACDAPAQIAWLHDERRPSSCRTGSRAEVAARFVPLQLDMTNEDDAANRMSERYGVSELPTVLAGSRRVTGFVRPAEMLAVLRQC